MFSAQSSFGSRGWTRASGAGCPGGLLPVSCPPPIIPLHPPSREPGTSGQVWGDKPARAKVPLFPHSRARALLAFGVPLICCFFSLCRCLSPLCPLFLHHCSANTTFWKHLYLQAAMQHCRLKGLTDPNCCDTCN